MQNFILLLPAASVWDFWSGFVSYPARIGIEKAPPHPVLKHFFHPPAPVQEDSQHSLSQINDPGIFLCLGGLGRIVCHRVLFRYGWDDQGGMETDECGAQRAEFRIPARNLNILSSVRRRYHRLSSPPYTCPYSVDNVAAVRTLACIGDDDFQVGVLVQDLLNSTVIAAFGRCIAGILLLPVVVCLVIADVVWSR